MSPLLVEVHCYNRKWQHLEPEWGHKVYLNWNVYIFHYKKQQNATNVLSYKIVEEMCFSSLTFVTWPTARLPYCHDWQDYNKIDVIDANHD